MTEDEWASSSDPQRMVLSLRGQADERKARLFGVACCRRLWHLLTDARCRDVVEMAERYADERAGRAAWVAAYDNYRAARRAFGSTAAFFAHAAVGHLLSDAANDPVGYAAAASSWAAGAGHSRAEEQAAQASLVRCIFGPLPLGPTAVDSAVLGWNDRLIPRLAQAIYEERRFGDLPLLGDALLDSGCEDDPLMAHCRAGVEHARGCWALDAILGRE
jgi:hypothetical protein